MFRHDFPVFMRESTLKTLAPQQPAARGSGFSALMGEVRADVQDFIAKGSPAGAWSALTVEGTTVRDRVQSSAGTESVADANNSQQQDFIQSILPLTREAGKRLGVAPELVAAHAALESGWGRHPLRNANGGDTHNLFGIKASAGWRGGVTQNVTTEHLDGEDVKKTERFRSYAGHGAAFRDYTQLLLSNPRHQAALNTEGDAHAFAKGLVKGGYATDPGYADKLVRTAGLVSKIASRIQSGD